MSTVLQHIRTIILRINNSQTKSKTVNHRATTQTIDTADNDATTIYKEQKGKNRAY